MPKGNLNPADAYREFVVPGLFLHSCLAGKAQRKKELKKAQSSLALPQHQTHHVQVVEQGRSHKSP